MVNNIKDFEKTLYASGMTLVDTIDLGCVTIFSCYDSEGKHTVYTLKDNKILIEVN